MTAAMLIVAPICHSARPTSRESGAMIGLRVICARYARNTTLSSSAISERAADASGAGRVVRASSTGFIAGCGPPSRMRERG